MKISTSIALFAPSPFYTLFEHWRDEKYETVMGDVREHDRSVPYI